MIPRASAQRGAGRPTTVGGPRINRGPPTQVLFWTVNPSAAFTARRPALPPRTSAECLRRPSSSHRAPRARAWRRGSFLPQGTTTWPPAVRSACSRRPGGWMPPDCAADGGPGYWPPVVLPVPSQRQVLAAVRRPAHEPAQVLRRRQHSTIPTSDRGSVLVPWPDGSDVPAAVGRLRRRCSPRGHHDLPRSPVRHHCFRPCRPAHVPPAGGSWRPRGHRRCWQCRRFRPSAPPTRWWATSRPNRHGRGRVSDPAHGDVIRSRSPLEPQRVPSRRVWKHRRRSRRAAWFPRSAHARPG